MSDARADTLALQDEDRLPWLEAVEDDGADERVPVAKLVGLIVAAVAAVALVVAGIWAMRARDSGMKGDGTLIAAEPGPYKVKPDDAGGMKVEGQGDSAFATSEGQDVDGKIDLAAMPEAPVEGSRAAAAAAPAQTGGKPAVTTAMPETGGRLVAAPAAKTATSAKATSGGGFVQLGAYDSESVANAGWTALTKRFAYLAPYEKSIEAAKVGGRTVYRLRANAGGDASTLCGKLKVAGERCFVVD